MTDGCPKLPDSGDINTSPVVVNRWRRYGKDRLYVTLSDETKIGYWDLLAGEGHPEKPEHLPTILAAVKRWEADQDTAPRETAAHDAAPVATTTLVPAAEMAEGTPGATASHDSISEPTTTKAPASAEDSPTVRPWLDLATNRAGAEAREQAQAAREAAPVRTVLARVLGVHTDERAWRIGADGEEKVAAQLAKVAKKDPRWRSLHAIPVGDRGSDIDHLLVGPGGVFTVNTKHHPGAKIWVGGNTFMVNGNRQPYVRNSRHEATRAAKLLTAACGFPVHVEGLVVTVNADDVVVKTQPDGVHVISRNNLAKWLLRHGDIHTGEALDSIYEAARRSTTWEP